MAGARERALRGVTRVHSQSTRLPQVAWSAILPRRPIHLIETDKRNGNVRLAELAVLALAAAAASPGEEIIEIGTSTGVRRSILQSMRRMRVRCSRSTCRRTIRPISGSTPANGLLSTSR
jgi:hypothetical protein